MEITDEIQSNLNPVGVNCLRAFPGRGIRVWGARTLSTDTAWTYVNVRRLVLTLPALDRGQHDRRRVRAERRAALGPGQP